VSDDRSQEQRAAAAEASIESVMDPGAQARREEDDRSRKRAKAERQAFLIGMMQHPVGRIWVKEVLDRFHAFDTRFASVNGLARDVEGTWLLAGEQRCGWWLWEQFDEADPVQASRLRRGA
jgi:hypothetical protein